MSSVTLVAKSKLPTPGALSRWLVSGNRHRQKDHAALVMGDIADGEPVLGRIHSECLTGDALFSLRCDCGFHCRPLWKTSPRRAAASCCMSVKKGEASVCSTRSGPIICRIRADTVEANVALGFAADMRDYTICADMLKALEVKSLRLMTNNPRKLKAMESFGIPVAERVPLQEGRNPTTSFISPPRQTSWITCSRNKVASTFVGASIRLQIGGVLLVIPLNH